MAVLKKEEFLEKIKNIVGDDKSDNAIAFIEDMTDTYDYYNSEDAGKEREDWERKYYDLDESWRNKYKERFFKSEIIETAKKDEEDKDAEKTDIKYEELFKEEK